MTDMICVDAYNEIAQQFDPVLAATLPKMADNLADGPVPYERAILDYLRNAGNLGSITDGDMEDVFTSEPTGIHDNGRSDGVYEWSEGLAYYVERYHLMLPNDFVKHILDESGVSGR